MEIVNITKDAKLITLIAVLLIILIFMIFIIISRMSTQNKTEDLSFNEIMIIILTGILIFSPIWIYAIFELKETNQYIIEYNSGTLEKTMTTQEIIDLVKNKNIFDEKKDIISTITITIPKGQQSKSFDNYVKWITENTDTQRKDKYESEKAQKLNEKYLNETHNVNVKN